jgi:hypothetical protein
MIRSLTAIRGLADKLDNGFKVRRVGAAETGGRTIRWNIHDLVVWKSLFIKGRSCGDVTGFWAY